MKKLIFNLMFVFSLGSQAQEIGVSANDLGVQSKEYSFFDPDTECYLHLTDGDRFAPIEVYNGTEKISTYNNIISASKKVDELIKNGDCLPRKNLPYCEVVSDGGLLTLNFRGIDYDNSIPYFPSHNNHTKYVLDTMDELVRYRVCRRQQPVECSITSKKEFEYQTNSEVNFNFGGQKLEVSDNYNQALKLMNEFKKRGLCDSQSGK